MFNYVEFTADEVVRLDKRKLGLEEESGRKRRKVEVYNISQRMLAECEELKRLGETISPTNSETPLDCESVVQKKRQHRKDSLQLQGARKRKISSDEEVQLKKSKYEADSIINDEEVQEVVKIFCKESLKQTSKNEDKKRKLDESQEEKKKALI